MQVFEFVDALESVRKVVLVGSLHFRWVCGSLNQIIYQPLPESLRNW